MSIIRRKKTKWTVIDNEIVDDDRLSISALGLLTYMLSKPDNWEFRQMLLCQRFGIGKEAMRSIFRNLKDCGYMQSEISRNEKGQVRTITVISESTGSRETRTPAEPALADPCPGQPQPLIKTEKTIKTNKVNKPDGVSQSVFDDYLLLRNRLKAPLTDTAIKGLQREALKANMTLEDVMALCCTKGWRGFDAEWVKQTPAKTENRNFV